MDLKIRKLFYQTILMKTISKIIKLPIPSPTNDEFYFVIHFQV